VADLYHSGSNLPNPVSERQRTLGAQANGFDGETWMVEQLMKHTFPDERALRDDTSGPAASLRIRIAGFSTNRILLPRRAGMRLYAKVAETKDQFFGLWESN
jgi:hypothetical protein